MNVNRIWDQSEYNAFTDLIRYQGRWLCVLREGTAHAGDDGMLRIISTDDGDNWYSLSSLKFESRDLRDAKFSITPDGQLMLNSYLAYKSKEQPGQSVSYFSNDAVHWHGPHYIGEPGFWLWRTDWHKQHGYSIGYGHSPERMIRLYRSRDGKHYERLLENLYDQNGPSEYALVFRDDDTCLCLLRRDNLKDAGDDNGLLGKAKPPYSDWQWQDLGCRIGGPEMISLADGRLIAAVRKYEFTAEGHYIREWLELCWVDEQQGRLETITELPSGGDCSYAGMVIHETELWISYYSAHEEKPCIYLARALLTEL